MNWRYCERCHRLVDAPLCPECGKAKKLRPPRDDDPCLLVERGAPYSGILSDVLRQHDIPFYTHQRVGAGLAMRVGSLLESSRFYVRFDDFSRANDLVDELFGEDAPR